MTSNPSNLPPSTKNLPWHPIPHSKTSSTCQIHLLQAGGLTIPTHLVLLPGPNQPSHYYAPDYVFLIHHHRTKTTHLFDLGIRPDLQTLPPKIKPNALSTFTCSPRSPASILRTHGSSTQQPESIATVIFSHVHFDHIGDVGVDGFVNAELWIGPGTCTYARPGYPEDPDGAVLSESFPRDGSRRIVEAFVDDEVLRRDGDERVGKVGRARGEGLYEGVLLRDPSVEKEEDGEDGEEEGRGWIGLGAFERAFDVWGDGAAYLVDAPGHAPGHQMMLVRVGIGEGGDEEDEFVLLAGDCFHHPELLEEPERTARRPFSDGSMHSEPEVAMETMKRTREFARRENVWVVGAHDFSIGEVVRPGVEVIEGLVLLNDWKKKGWKKGFRS